MAASLVPYFPYCENKEGTQTMGAAIFIQLTLAQRSVRLFCEKFVRKIRFVLLNAGLVRNLRQQFIIPVRLNRSIGKSSCHSLRTSPSGRKYAMEHSWPKVILFGDSLTQYGYSKDGCWVASLGDYLQRKCDIINRGFSGYNSRWCKIILPKLVTENDAKSTCLVTIFLGANDSVDSQVCANQHVPLDEFKKNILDMVEYLQSIGIPKDKIVIMTPPPCVEGKWMKECELKEKNFGKYNAPTKLYADACLEIAKEAGTHVVDLYTPMMNQENWEDMLNDGLHFSARGSDFVFEQLKPIVDKVLGELPFQFPYWADVDNSNPTIALSKY